MNPTFVKEKSGFFYATVVFNLAEDENIELTEVSCLSGAPRTRKFSGSDVRYGRVHSRYWWFSRSCPRSEPAFDHNLPSSHFQLYQLGFKFITRLDVRPVSHCQRRNFMKPIKSE